MPQDLTRRTLSEAEFTAIRDRVLDSLPSDLDEAGFNRIAPTMLEGAIAEAEYSREPLTGSAIGRFVGGAADMLNPVALAKGVYQAATSPIETLKGIGSASVDQGRQALDSFRQGGVLNAIEGIGHTAGMLPLVGPAAVEAGQQIAAGDIAGGLGKGVGMLATSAALPAARAIRRSIPASGRAGIAQQLEQGAAERVSDVMTPKVGANKTRFANMADDAAPQLLQRGAVRGFSREALHGHVGERLAQAEQALDAASDARLNARTFPTAPIISDLMAKRRLLTAEAVEGSQFKPQTGVNRPPIGTDVVPGPNAARVAEIDKAISEIRALGQVARYEPLRVIRQAYDGPAKAVYNPSMTQDFLRAQGGKLGAADVTGVLRDALAKFDPGTAAANADYALYRRANDVLEAAAEIERARPTVGRQIMARLTGATVGGQTAGAQGAVAGFVLGPVLEAAVGSGATTKLATARTMQRLADAIRRGDQGHVNSLVSQLKRLSTHGAVLTGRDTPTSTSPEALVPMPAR